VAAIELIESSASASAALDIAISDALLRAVGAGTRPATVRLLVPGPTVAFGRVDTLKPGFADACRAARSHGFEPVVRVAGGHAAAYDEQSLVIEEVVPDDDVVSGLHDRFRRGAEVVVTALRSLGVDAEVGELSGEYCPGAYSIHVAGRLKVAGIAQRATKDAALVSTVVVVGGGPRIRAVVADVYAALGLPIEAEVTGAVQDVAPAMTVSALRDAVVRAFAQGAALVPGEVDAALLAAAENVRPRHVVG
jgi:octanoyl-[GcvH]:protein N-octanoyltransferase